MMLRAFVEMNLVRSDDARQDLRIARHQRRQLFLGNRVGIGDGIVAGDEDPAFAAIELDAVRIVAGDRHRDAIRVARLVLNAPCTSHKPLFGNSAVPQTSTGPVCSVSMPQCAVSTWCAPQPVIMPAPNCSQRSQPGRLKSFWGCTRISV